MLEKVKVTRLMYVRGWGMSVQCVCLCNECSRRWRWVACTVNKSCYNSGWQWQYGGSRLSVAGGGCGQKHRSSLVGVRTLLAVRRLTDDGEGSLFLSFPQTHRTKLEGIGSEWALFLFVFTIKIAAFNNGLVKKNNFFSGWFILLWLYSRHDRHKQLFLLKPSTRLLFSGAGSCFAVRIVFLIP